MGLREAQREPDGAVRLTDRRTCLGAKTGHTSAGICRWTSKGGLAVTIREPHPDLMTAPQRQTDGHFPLSPGNSVRMNRLATFVESMLAIRRLTPRQVDDFMASYVIYNLDWRDEQQMIETLGPSIRREVTECLIGRYSVLNHLSR